MRHLLRPLIISMLVCCTLVGVVVLVLGGHTGEVAAMPRLGEPDPRGPFYSYFQIQAVEAGDTSVTIEYYDASGSPIGAAMQSTTLTGEGDSEIFYQALNPGLPEGFRGSVVISSSQPVVAISSATDFYGSNYAQSSAETAEPSTNVLLPLIMKYYSKGWSTRLAVQNAGLANANVTIKYYSDTDIGPCIVGTPCHTETPTIKPGASYFTDQTAIDELPNGFKGSATIESDQPVVAEVLQWLLGEMRLQSYNGFPASYGDTVFYAPLNMNNFSNNWYTYIQVQNVDISASANITITYSTSPETVFTDTVATSQTYYASLAGLPNGWIGSATIESDRSILAIVGEAQNNPTHKYAATIHNAFPPSAGATKVYAPISMKNFSLNWYTHIMVQSVDPSVSNPITITYSNGAVRPDTLDASHPSEIYYASLEPGLPDGFLGSAVIEAAHPIVAVIGTNRAGTVKGDMASRFWAMPAPSP